MISIMMEDPLMVNIKFI